MAVRGEIEPQLAAGCGGGGLERGNGWDEGFGRKDLLLNSLVAKFARRGPRLTIQGVFLPSRKSSFI